MKTKGRNNTPIDLDAEAAFHKAIGIPPRLRMALALLEHGELASGALADVAALDGLASQGGASTHLQRMKAAGVIVSRTSAQQRLYSLHPDYRDAVAEVARRVGGPK